MLPLSWQGLEVSCTYVPSGRSELMWIYSKRTSTRHSTAEHASQLQSNNLIIPGTVEEGCMLIYVDRCGCVKSIDNATGRCECAERKRHETTFGTIRFSDPQKCTNRWDFEALYQPMQMRDNQGILVSSNRQKGAPSNCVCSQLRQ